MEFLIECPGNAPTHRISLTEFRIDMPNVLQMLSDLIETGFFTQLTSEQSKREILLAIHVMLSSADLRLST